MESMKTYEPRKAFRFIVQIDGVDAFKIKKITSDYGPTGLETCLEMYWTEEAPEVQVNAKSGVVKMNDAAGNVVLQREFAWEYAIVLPFNFDYASTTLTTKIKLLNCLVGPWETPA